MLQLLLQNAFFSFGPRVCGQVLLHGAKHVLRLITRSAAESTSVLAKCTFPWGRKLKIRTSEKGIHSINAMHSPVPKTIGRFSCLFLILNPRLHAGLKRGNSALKRQLNSKFLLGGY